MRLGNEWLARGVVQRVAIFRVSAAVQPSGDTEILHDLVILHGDLASWTTAQGYGCTDVQTKLGARAWRLRLDLCTVG